MKHLPFNQNRQSQGILPVAVGPENVYCRYAFQVITESGTVVHYGQVDCDIIEAAEVEKLALDDYGHHVRDKHGHGSDIAESMLARPHTVIFTRERYYATFITVK